MISEEKIRQRAYEIYLETGDGDAKVNWRLAKLQLGKEDYYHKLGKCPHCGTKFNNSNEKK